MSEDFTEEQLDHITALLAAQEEVAKHRDWLIAHELGEQLPEFQAKEEAAAKEQQRLWNALQEPEKALAKLEMEISHAIGESGQWQEKLDTADEMGERVAARAWFTEWEAQINVLTAQKDLLERELEPVREMYLAAKQATQDAAEKRAALQLNMCIPTHDLGQQTTAFRAWFLESGAFASVLLSGDRDHYLWAAAFDFMDVICNRSGYRTNHLASDAENVKRSIEHYAAAKLNARNASDAPSGAEVMAMDARRIAELKPPTRERIEDYRR